VWCIHSDKYLLVICRLHGFDWTKQPRSFLLGFHHFHLLMNTLAVVALLVFGVSQSISGAWRGWASAGLTGQYYQTFNLVLL
jgi:hypothetical protein